MPATLATVDAILKEIYEPSIREQLNDDVVTLRRVERSSEGVTSEVGGKYVVFPIHVSRNSGIGARLDGENLPNAGNQGYARAQVPLRYQYGRVQLSGPTIALADTNFQSFASALNEEVNGIKDDLAKDLNRQIYGDGTGIIATLSGTGPNWTVNSTNGLQIGMAVDLSTVSGTTWTRIVTGGTISAIDVANSTVTFSGGTGTVAAAQVLTRAESGGAGATAVGTPVNPGLQREWTGFKKIVAATGSLFNVDPATQALWAARVDDNPAGTGGTPRALSEGLMLLNCDYVRTGGSSTSVMFSNLGVRRAYFNLLSQQRRFSNTQEFEGGFSGLAFTTDKGEIPMVVDVDCPKNTIYGLNEKQIKVYRDEDWSFMNRDGSNWSRVPNKDAYEATLYQYSEIGTHRRNAHFVIKDLIEG